MTRIYIGVLVGLTALVPVRADITACSDIFSLADMLPGNPWNYTGCTQGDKLYEQFSYSLPDADLVAVDFAPADYAVTFTGGWSQNFVLGYTLSVWQGPFYIASGKLIATYPATETNPGELTTTMTDSAAPGLELAATPGAPGPVSLPFTGPTQSTVVLHTYNAAGATLHSFESAVAQVAIPEPATFGFVGAAILGLAATVRRRASSGE